MWACDVNLFVEYIFGLEALSFPLYSEISHLMHKTFADGKMLRRKLVFSGLSFGLGGFEKHSSFFLSLILELGSRLYSSEMDSFLCLVLNPN